jgi:thioredoxin-like negative regulator of GroEL
MRQPSTGVLVVTATAESTGRGPALLFAHDPDPIPDVLADRYGVRGIPAVKPFRDGTVAAAFTGALPEPRVRAGLDLQVGRTRQ